MKHATIRLSVTLGKHGKQGYPDRTPPNDGSPSRVQSIGKHGIYYARGRNAR